MRRSKWEPTARQREILETMRGVTFWVRPMDIGGRDASWHSAVLKQLARRGLVEQRARGTLSNFLRGATDTHGSSYRYKLTRAGRRLAERLARSRATH